MNLEIQYQIQFVNGNYIKGRVNCRVGEDINCIKAKIIDFQGLKIGHSFKFIDSTLSSGNKVSNSTKNIYLRQQKENNFGSVFSVRSRKMSDESMFEEASIIIQDNCFHNFIEEQPQIPPVVCGYVTFPNSLFFCFSSKKYLVLDTQSLVFYENKQSAHPLKQVKAEEIQQIKSYKRKHFFCIRIILKGEQINMKFINKDVCKEWVGYLNQVINFSHYLKQKQAFSKEQSFQRYVETLLKSKNNLDSTNIVKLDDEQDTEVFSVHSNIPCQNSIKRIYKKILKLSSFDITHKIDSGSFSTVYLATKNGKQMALKQMNKDKLLYKGQIKYALTQLSVLIRSQACPFIIPIYYAFQTHEYVYLALKYIPYGNLGRLIEKRKKLEESQAIILIGQLICAIQFLHGLKVLYRDLKPENILLDGSGHLYLTDFGLAKEMGEQQQAHSFLGTPLYLAPQRFLGTGSGIDYRSDIYAVGIIFFEMLHGYHPFFADNFNSVLYNIKNTEVEIDQTLSPLVRNFLQQTLERNPSKRLSKMSNHLLFKKLDWKKLQNRQLPGIKISNQVSKPSVQINYQIDVDYNQDNYPDKKIVGWNYDFQQKQ